MTVYQMLAVLIVFLVGTLATGAIFLGPFTPVALGDYAAGPSHVLPTGGTARFVDSSVERMQVKVEGFTPERFVLACGSYSPRLARPLGLRLPVWPTGLPWN